MLAKRLRTARKFAGLTQDELGDKVGLESSKSIRDWEKGRRSPSRDNLEKTAEVLGVSMDWLAGRTDTGGPDGAVIEPRKPREKPAATSNPIVLSRMAAELRRMADELDKLAKDQGEDRVLEAAPKRNHELGPVGPGRRTGSMPDRKPSSQPGARAARDAREKIDGEDTDGS